MQVGRFLEATMLYTGLDGRTVFRPWGAKGPCYLVGPADRRRFTRFISIYYGLLFLLILCVPFVFGPKAIFIGLGCWMVGFYMAFWFLARGLPTTTPPLATPAERHAAIQTLTKQIGRPAVWIILGLSLLMLTLAIALLLAGQVLVGILGVITFGTSATLMVWWLRQTRAV
jgi:hypothetical protein